MGVGGSGSRRPDTGLGQQPGPGPLGSTGRPQLALELALHLPDTFSARYSGPLSSTQQEGFPKRGHCQNTLAHTHKSTQTEKPRRRGHVPFTSVSRGTQGTRTPLTVPSAVTY